MFVEDFIAIEQFKLSYAPTQIRIIHEIVLLKDKEGLLRFHNLNDFSLINSLNCHGTIGNFISPSRHPFQFLNENLDATLPN